MPSILLANAAGTYLAGRGPSGVSLGVRQVALAALLMSLAAPTGAQEITVPRRDETPRWIGHFTVLAGNAAVGALTAGLLQKLRRGSFQDGFTRGALGGSVVYLGKRVAVEHFAGAGLVGREIAAVGTSMVRNASDGLPTVSRLFVPLGPLPVRLDLDLRGGLALRPRLDVTQLAWVSWGLLESRLGLDPAESLSSGAPVFRAVQRGIISDDEVIGGFAASRSIFLSDPAVVGIVSPGHLLAHERVHVLQQDFVLTAWSEPLTGAVLGRFGAGRRMERYVAWDALDWVLGTVRNLFFTPETERRFPVELEARFLSASR